MQGYWAFLLTDYVKHLYYPNFIHVKAMHERHRIYWIRFNWTRRASQILILTPHNQNNGWQWDHGTAVTVPHSTKRGVQLISGVVYLVTEPCKKLLPSSCLYLSRCINRHLQLCVAVTLVASRLLVTDPSCQLLLSQVTCVSPDSLCNCSELLFVTEPSGLVSNHAPLVAYLMHE